MGKKPHYCCPRCDYNTNQKNMIRRHFYVNKKICPALVSDIELTEETKQYVLENRVLNKDNKESKRAKTKDTTSSNRIKQLEIELAMSKNIKNENFYQNITEIYLKGTHKTLVCGITDITTEHCHAEIKKWEDYKYAVGQLITYNFFDPKEAKQLYLFGTISKKLKKVVCELCEGLNIQLFTYIINNNIVQIQNVLTEEVVYDYHVQV